MCTVLHVVNAICRVCTLPERFGGGGDRASGLHYCGKTSKERLVHICRERSMRGTEEKRERRRGRGERRKRRKKKEKQGGREERVKNKFGEGKWNGRKKCVQKIKNKY